MRFPLDCRRSRVTIKEPKEDRPERRQLPISREQSNLLLKSMKVRNGRRRYTVFRCMSRSSSWVFSTFENGLLRIMGCKSRAEFSCLRSHFSDSLDYSRAAGLPSCSPVNTLSNLPLLAKCRCHCSCPSVPSVCLPVLVNCGVKGGDCIKENIVKRGHRQLTPRLPVPFQLVLQRRTCIGFRLTIDA
jgi:hypothetical protein